jgi:L-ascorbate metabolism protein UlaG (beta-lactamase superfamily)
MDLKITLIKLTMNKYKKIRFRKTIIALTILISLSVVASQVACTTYGGKMKGKRLEKMQKSKQYQRGKFFNKYKKNSDVNNWTSMLGEWIFGDEIRKPKEKLAIYPFDYSSLDNRSEDSLKVTWNGHSSSIIQIEGKLILTDPVYSEAASPYPLVSPKRFHEESPLNADSMPHVDLVIISHNHYDHLDHKTIMKLYKKVDKFVMPLGVGAYLEDWGVPSEKIIELDWWESIDVSSTLKITATPSQHFSNRYLNDRNETLWASWAIIGEKHRLFFSGDSGYSPDFKVIGEKLGPFDMTMIEMGAYSEYWPEIHMNPKEAVQAHIDLRGDLLHPIHWGTFQLSLTNWTEPIEELLETAAEHGVQVATPMAGETTVYGSYVPSTEWWELTEPELELVTE